MSQTCEWIPVTSRLPETIGRSEDYLVRLCNGDMIVAAWMNIGGWDFEPEEPITHWRHLPESPNEVTPEKKDAAHRFTSGDKVARRDGNPANPFNSSGPTMVEKVWVGEGEPLPPRMAWDTPGKAACNIGEIAVTGGYFPVWQHARDWRLATDEEVEIRSRHSDC